MANLQKNVPVKMQGKLNDLRAFIEAHDDIQTLLDNSASWADGRMEAEQKSRANAWRVAFVAVAMSAVAFIVAGGAVYTSMQPAPPPQILRVDKATGSIEHLVSLKDFQQTAEEATIRRAISTFLRARENYSADTAEDNYYDAAAFMSPQMQAQWAKYWDTGNPQSPQNYYKKDGKIRIDIGAITISRNGGGVPMSARVSFRRTIKRGDILAGPVTAWIATMPFHWVNAATSERARLINELGLEFTDYVLDQDAVPNNSTAPVLPEPVKPVAQPQPVVAMAAPQSPPPPVVSTGAPQ